MFLFCHIDIFNCNRLSSFDGFEGIYCMHHFCVALTLCCREHVFSPSAFLWVVVGVQNGLLNVKVHQVMFWKKIIPSLCLGHNRFVSDRKLLLKLFAFPFSIPEKEIYCWCCLILAYSKMSRFCFWQNNFSFENIWFWIQVIDLASILYLFISIFSSLVFVHLSNVEGRNYE